MLHKFTLDEVMLAHPPTAVEALTLIASLDYQSCERDDWEQSPARALLSHMERALITELPGYDYAARAV